MKLSEGRFTVFDTETTGTRTDNDRVIEVGWATFEKGEAVDVGSEIVDPGIGYDRGQYIVLGHNGIGVKIPEEAYAVHGISPADCVGKVRFEQVVTESNWADVVVSYNGMHFDKPIMEREAEMVGSPWRLSRDHIDVMLFVNWHFRRLRSRKLSALAKYFGVKPDGQLHRASTDCVLVGQLLFKLIAAGIVPDDCAHVLRRQALIDEAIRIEMEEYSIWIYEDRVNGEMRMGCGREIGKRLVDLPNREFAYWLGKVDDLPPKVKFIFNRGANR